MFFCFFLSKFFFPTGWPLVTLLLWLGLSSHCCALLRLSYLGPDKKKKTCDQPSDCRNNHCRGQRDTIRPFLTFCFFGGVILFLFFLSKLLSGSRVRKNCKEMCKRCKWWNWKKIYRVKIEFFLPFIHVNWNENYNVIL